MLKTIVLVACLSLGSLFASAENDRPNILFVYCDDHAQAAIGAYGSTINQTPSIDRLAREGMVFENSFVTNSICAPARAVILTGRFSHLNGVMTNAETFDPSQQTFVKLLRQAGYQTAVIGKWHLKSDPEGFDYYAVLEGQGPYYNPRLHTSRGDISCTGYTTDIITDQAIKWLDEASTSDRPFLLMYQHKAPHRNWMPEPDHFDLYEDVEIPAPATLFDDYANRAPGAAAQEMTIARHMMGMYDLKLSRQFPGFAPAWEKNYLNGLTEGQRAAWEAGYAQRNDEFERRYDAGELTGDALTLFKYQRYIKDYLRVIASVDENLGRVLAYLDEHGLADNTVVIYSSDQGFYLGEHGWYDKRWMYEQSLRTPLIIRWPGQVEPGLRSSALVQNLDMAPTFLDMAGLDVPGDMQGKSLVPLLRRTADEHEFRDAIYYHYYEYPRPHRVPAHYGVRTHRYKLIYYPMYDAWELFDLERDPDELQSVYDDPAYADVAASLKKRLHDLQVEYGDLQPNASALEVLQQNRLAEAARTPTALVHVQGGDADIDPSNKPLTVGARTRVPESGGVVVAHGGGSFGYALFFDGQTPCFAVRDAGEVFITRGLPLESGTAVHIVGVLNRKAEVELWVNGQKIAAGPARFITRKPAEGLDVGKDSGSSVGPYEGDQQLAAPIHDLRIYWGTLSKDDLRRWAGTHRP